MTAPSIAATQPLKSTIAAPRPLGDARPCGDGPVEVQRATISLLETRATLSRPAPLLGEHTREVCCDLLGLSEAEVHALVEEALLT